jgi:hypothetical protein
MRCRTSVLLLPGDEGLVTVPAGEGEIARLLMPTPEKQLAAWLTLTIAGPLSEILEIEGLVDATVAQQEDRLLEIFADRGVAIFDTPCGEHDYHDVRAALAERRITIVEIENAIITALPHARRAHEFSPERLDFMRKLLIEHGRFVSTFRPAAS